MAEKTPKVDVFKSLTWTDIETWAGKTLVSRGHSYQQSHQVREIACTSTGGIIAWIQGSKRYATLVDIEKGALISDCTCGPYGDTLRSTQEATGDVTEYRSKSLCLAISQLNVLICEAIYRWSTGRPPHPQHFTLVPQSLQWCHCRVRTL